MINGKTISSQILKEKDKVSIGNTDLLFVEKASVAFPKRQARAVPRPPKTKKKWLTPPRLILIIALIGVPFLLMTEDSSKEKKELNLGLRAESQVLEEVEALKQLNEEESKKKALSPRAKAAKVAFIKGFRDYRKGYFHRALKMFQHCLTLHKTHSLCQSYSGKSKVQIERLIQKKIRLGNGYKANKQYEACRAVFKNVEIMIQDPRNPVYKEARQNKRLCEIQLENQI